MRVICIDNKSIRLDKAADRMLVVGKEYNATQCSVWEDHYVIEGAEIDPLDQRRVSFGKRRFIPISEIDETQFERNYNKQLA